MSNTEEPISSEIPHEDSSIERVTEIDEVTASSNSSGSSKDNTQPTSNNNDQSKEDTISQILEYKQKIDVLVNNVRNTKRLCEKYDNENYYLQDYIGTLMNSGDLNKK